MSENLTIWESLKTTPKDMTKSFKKTGFSGTDIKPAYRIQRLTEVFGPCGKGWGCEVVERWVEELPEKTKIGDKQYEYTTVSVAFVTARLWWLDGDTKHFTNEHTGGTICGFTPDEVWKQAETDAYGKCALDVGVAADVYLGEFDGSKYRQHDGSSKPQQQSSKPTVPTWDGNDWKTCVMHIPFKKEGLRDLTGKTLAECYKADKGALDWLAKSITLDDRSNETDKQHRRALDMYAAARDAAQTKQVPPSDDPPWEDGRE